MPSGGGAHRPPLMDAATGSAPVRVARNDFTLETFRVKCAQAIQEIRIVDHG